jgi:hypothetical protein
MYLIFDSGIGYVYPLTNPILYEIGNPIVANEVYKLDHLQQEKHIRVEELPDLL